MSGSLERTSQMPAGSAGARVREMIHLVDALSTAQALVTPHRRVVHANAAFAQALGRTAGSEVAGRTLDELFGPDPLLDGSLPSSRAEVAVPVGRCPCRLVISPVGPVGVAPVLSVVELLAVDHRCAAAEGTSRQGTLPSVEELQARLVDAERQAVRVEAVATALARALTVEDVVEVMSREVHWALGGDGMQIGLLDDSGHLRLVHMQGPGRSLLGIVEDVLQEGSATLAEVARTGTPVTFSTPEEYLARNPDRREFVEASHQSSWALLPLTASGRTLGGWSVSFRRPGRVTPERLALMAVLAGLCAQSFERATLYGRETESALRLQEALAPGRLPDLPGVTLYGRHLPSGGAAVVGGDFYDAIPVDDRSVVLAVGDVAGHGVQASASMSQVRTMLRVYAADGRSPAGALEGANALLCGPTASPMVTCALLRLDVATGEAELSLAGHPPPVLLSPDGRTRLLEVAPRLPLGCEPAERYTEHRVVLRPGDVLLLYTDGLVESRRQSLDEGLAALLALPYREDAATLVDELVRTVPPPDGDDDVAVLAVRLDGPADG